MSSPTQSKTPSLAKHSIPPKVDSPSAQHHLIYFITGNPGLVSLYENFLNTLHTLLSESPSISPDSDIFSIYGQDLAGYETATSFSENDKRTPYTLEEVIEVSMTSLEDLRIESGPRKGQPYDSVIIISHSLGTYMALEIIQRLRKRASPVNVTAAVLLFATVTNIGGSPNGLKFTRLFKIPGFAKKASTAAKLLLDRVPAAALRWILTNFSRNPADAAAKITSFLKSRMGIWQTLSLAEEEMREISEDRWDEEVWGAEKEDQDTKSRAPKLVFFFGQNDLWVAKHTRDALIAARGRTEQDMSSSKPLMILDEDDLPHDFCLRHAEIVAEKVAVWLSDIVSKRLS